MFIVIAFALAGYPVWRLTRPAAALVSVAAAGESLVAVGASDAKAVPLDVEAVFAPAPADFQIKNLDRTVLAGRGPQARFSARWTAAVPSEGVDLVIQARWSEAVVVSETGLAAGATATASANNPAAARITVRFVDGRLVEKSFWAAANGALAEVFTVPGTPSAEGDAP